MASTAAVRSAPSRAVSDGHRGKPDLVRRTALVAAVIEGQSLATEVMRRATDIQTLGATGNRQQVVHAAGRLGSLAQSYRDEFRRLAGEVEQ